MGESEFAHRAFKFEHPDIPSHVYTARLFFEWLLVFWTANRFALAHDLLSLGGRGIGIQWDTLTSGKL